MSSLLFPLNVKSAYICKENELQKYTKHTAENAENIKNTKNTIMEA